MINLDNIDAVDKWIDLHYQVVWSILFVLAGVGLRRNRIALFLLSYSHDYYPKVLRILIDLRNFLTQFFLRTSNVAPPVAEDFSISPDELSVNLRGKVVIFVKTVANKYCNRYNLIILELLY